MRIENGIITDWQRVEEDFEAKYLDGTYAPHGLRLVKIISRSPILHLVFQPVLDSDNSALFAQCQMDHPFFVKDKGWQQRTNIKYKVRLWLALTAVPFKSSN